MPAVEAEIGESHRVELVDALVVDDLHWIVTFRDLDGAGRSYREAYHRSEFRALRLGDRGELVLIRSKIHKQGRWRFEPEGKGGNHVR